MCDTKNNCQRCGQPTGGATIMSAFNTDVICLVCKAVERKHPSYDRAVMEEHREIKNGNFNFKGIGLPDDLKPKEVVS